MQIKKVKISEVKVNPNNPRLIKDDKFDKLVRSVKEFPEMLDIRPIVVNEQMIILGGNMRFKACKAAGLKEIPIIIAKGLTKDQEDEFLIKDNTSGGEWDWKTLANDWDQIKLEDWGLDVPEIKESAEAGEVDFSEFIDEENNYIVLFFDNRIDWLSAQTHFNLKTVSSKRSNGKPWSKGIGRVVPGGEYLRKLRDEQ